MNFFDCFFYLKYNNFTLNISLSIKENDIVFLVGDSGSGKTTLLKCISGLIKPYKGFLKINNEILQDSKNSFFKESYNRNIGHVFQFPLLFPNMSVFENIFINKNKIYKYINESKLIKLFNLEKLKKRSVFDLSGGEKQRVAVLQVIFMQPRLILLDEVFSSQDINMKKIMVEIFNEINFFLKIPIICVSHDLNTIKKLTNKFIYLSNGKLLYKNFD